MDWKPCLLCTISCLSHPAACTNVDCITFRFSFAVEQPGGFEHSMARFVDSAYLTQMVNCNIEPSNSITTGVIVIKAIAPDQ